MHSLALNILDRIESWTGSLAFGIETGVATIFGAATGNSGGFASPGAGSTGSGTGAPIFSFNGDIPTKVRKTPRDCRHWHSPVHTRSVRR
jgi:hypothetical protein